MSINTSTFSDFVRLAPFTWVKSVKSVPMVARNSGLFKVIAFPAGTGDTREFNEIDVQEYSKEKPEGDQAEVAIVQQGYTKILTLRRFGTDISVTWETRQRNKYDDVLDKITALGSMQAKRQDLDLTHRLTFGTATTYTDMDGKVVDISVGDTLALFSTAHTLKGSSTTFRNILANNPQLSRGALELIEKQIVENTYNQLGQKKSNDYDILWTTDDPNTNNTARELMQATAKIDAPNEGVPNVYVAKYRIVSLPRLATDKDGANDTTKAKYWGLASSSSTTGKLAVEQDPTLNSPSIGSNAEDVSTEDLTYRGRTSYGIVVVSANWIQLSKGNGDA